MIVNKLNKPIVRKINGMVKSTYKKCGGFNRGCGKLDLIMGYMIDAMVWNIVNDCIKQSNEIYTYEMALDLRNKAWNCGSKSNEVEQ